MKNIVKIIMLLVVVFTMSCSKDFLETSPSSSIGQKQAEQTEQGVGAILQGLHSMVYSYNFGQGFGLGQPSMAVQLDIMGDDVINTLPAFYMEQYRYTGSMTASNDSHINYKAWDYYYTIIQHANKLLNGIENLSGLSPETKANFLGQGYAFRAWAYHNLVQLFGKRYQKGGANDQLGVIIRTPDKLEDHLPRSTVAEVYDYIQADMTKALEYLKDVPNSGKKNDLRYATVCGIAARIALSKENWEEAEKYASLAIEKSGASLQTGKSLLNGFNDINATEWMWAYKQGADQNFYYNGFFAHYSYNFNSSRIRSLRIAINRDIYDDMGENDVRRKWWVCLDRGDKIPSDAYDLYFRGGVSNPNWEITGQSIKFKALSATDSRGDVVVMRLAEMYYIKAEAEARQSKEAQARETLNKIMITRDPDYNTVATGDALINEVMRNKRIDLWLEGQRFFDMKRLKEVHNRVNSKNITRYLRGSRKQTAINRNSGEFVQNIPTSPDSKYWQFAIPYGEIKGNPLCQQNEL
ncbi:RagB/SusD family nutrient uptake outer membrane protein [Capnocytophaga canimorsus]|uniref:RagB/SusD family nutrient uptake outer membrane protein n=1 Tax=Capnocytophaga canimorsus TaxID=28188 RepID=UPI0037D3F8AD